MPSNSVIVAACLGVADLLQEQLNNDWFDTLEMGGKGFTDKEISEIHDEMWRIMEFYRDKAHNILISHEWPLDR